ncbi:unnamed protein product [Bursaphelenchus xylophilus]|uniref:(pine wood nematode) hypothetical protein n=1 Tax=Bursaphelenchus xylophilus TaxID=6326 RepID=A0A1I7SC24_BURXY|nr:unnamed protein product [Bursaphelenchus xylophilus]CAG9086433.1 unnamed protein product [Bursaphelenchus xylophilus]
MQAPRELQHFADAFSKASANAIRNVCIIAHVDHGKTTIADALISSNGIIPPRLVGQMRFLDSREDEQERGITMKSSVVSLSFDPLLLNLVDSPGHVDFLAEVNSAVNVADVALLVVDVVEGVCSQTESLLRQAVLNQVQVILVLNKIDRLITELKLTESEGFQHIRQLIENVNSTLSQIFHGLLLEEQTDQIEWDKMDAVELRHHFHPSHGNVLFSSAIFGYAFSVEDFASKWAPKLKLEASYLQDNLFSDCYFASGQLQHDAERKGKKTLFEQLVLTPLWEVYKVAFQDKDVDKLKTTALKLGLPALKSKRCEEAFHELMRTWMPLSSAVARAVARCQSAKQAFTSDARIARIFPANDCDEIVKGLKSCDPEDPLLLLFIMKLYVIDDKKLAVCRVMNGIVKKDQFVFPVRKDKESDSQRVNSINIMLGKDLHEVEQAVAGSIVAVEFTDFPSSCTLSNQKINSEGLGFDTAGMEPLVRVTLRTSLDLQTATQLKQGLKHLSIVDPSVRVFEQEDGDLALVTAGEVHLQKCLQDLEQLGLTDLEVSEPIVPFLETTVPDLQSSNAKIVATHLTECFLKNFNLKLKLRAVPLSEEIVQVMKKYEKCLSQFKEGIRSPELLTFLKELKEAASSTLPGTKGTFWVRKTREDVEKIFDGLWTFGPRKAKFNILFNMITEKDDTVIRSLERAVIGGFELAMSLGPLCDEPMHGVGIVVEELGFVAPEEDSEEEKEPVEVTDPQLQGQMISAAKQTIRAALRKTPMRLVTPMYKCKIQTSAQALGKVHTVLGQRHAKVLDEDINQATGFFEIDCYLPIVESFDFCEQLRKKTSGVASAQLHFSHWQVIDEDPFWQPSTEEELEEFGEKGDTVNQAREYMNNIRRRKGLPTDEVLVVNAEKQRNLNRKK